MILTVTLNPAIDKILILKHFQVHKLHRLQDDEQSLTVPGGKGVNIALNLNLLGQQVVATGFAAGHPGHMLCDALRGKDITTSFIFTQGSTRTNLSILDTEKETLTELNDRGPIVPPEDVAFFLENYNRVINRAKCVVLAGSLPRGVDPGLLTTLIESAREKGIKVVAHVSPKYIESVIKSQPFLLNPDMRSYHELLGQALDGIPQFIQAGKDILVQQPKTEIILFTHRVENVVAVTRKGSYILRPRDLKIVNMLGYADAYLAGFIDAYLRGLSYREALTYASAAGLTNIEVLYKEICDIKQIERNLSRIEVEERP